MNQRRKMMSKIRINKVKTYTANEIKAAVDAIIGDDGFRGAEVINLLETWEERNEKDDVTN